MSIPCKICEAPAPLYRQCPISSCKFEIGFCQLHGGDANATSKMAEHIALHRVTAACPSDECILCTGAACNLCGAGCWNPKAPHCEHAADERHQARGPLVERRSCNRHKDCDEADRVAMFRWEQPARHCDDECCEDCFGY